MFLSVWGYAGEPDTKISRSEYINTWKNEAISQMVKYGVPASITLAQGILESGDGNSMLAKEANNHFGIKCHNWGGEGVYKDDDKKDECFRKYNNAKQSYEDHSKFLANGKRYQFLFDYDITNYKAWAKGLKQAGYATNPEYAKKLIYLIEKHDLHQYDNALLAVNETSPTVSNTNSLQLVLSKPTLATHSVKKHQNKIRYVVVKEGDTFYKIAKEFEMGLWQLYKYNDLSSKDYIKPGDVIYLQPKRNKARIDSHIVKKGETMQGISQLYGIKLKKLYKKNKMVPGTEPLEDQKLLLK